MTDIRCIVLHVDSSTRSAARIAAAGALAERLDATVTALYAVTPTVLRTPTAMGEATAMMALLQDHDDQRKERASALFERMNASPRVRWEALSDVLPIAGFVRSALTADLLMVGQYDPAAPEGEDDVPADFPQTVLVDSGKPAIVLPYVGDFRSMGRVALVAWKPTREAARALSAALPLLKQAAQVHVASWGDEPREVEHLLLRHGIDAVLHREGPAGADVGERMLSRASEIGADLLVMGCYGHGRAREFVLGGASRTILASMTLPVLMAH